MIRYMTFLGASTFAFVACCSLFTPDLTSAERDSVEMAAFSHRLEVRGILGTVSKGSGASIQERFADFEKRFPADQYGEGPPKVVRKNVVRMFHAADMAGQCSDLVSAAFEKQRESIRSSVADLEWGNFSGANRRAKARQEQQEEMQDLRTRCNNLRSKISTAQDDVDLAVIPILEKNPEQAHKVGVGWGEAYLILVSEVCPQEGHKAPDFCGYSLNKIKAAVAQSRSDDDDSPSPQ